MNQFVRNYMLEKTDVQTMIEDLQKSYKNSTVCYNIIEQARQQLEVLIPLAKEANDYQELIQEVTDLQQNLALAPAYFAKQKFELLVQEITKIKQQLVRKKEKKKESDRQLEDLRQQETDLKISISQDSIGRRLEELKREIKQCTQEVNSKKNKAAKYDELAELLQLPLYQDNDTFFTAREQGEILQQEIDNVLEKLEIKRDELVSQRKELEKQQGELQTELDSLRQRKSQIPQRNLDIRDRIADSLNLDQTDLPFVGELLKVRADASVWEGAIERLLRGFGLCVLVSDIDYKKVNSYVSNNFLKGRLVYYRVTASSPQAIQRAPNPNKVPSKLEIKPDNQTFYQWLQNQLVKSYNYSCCDTEEDFYQQTQAITKTGLIKQGGERHIKDDRFPIDARSSYILGWDNAEKIAAIAAELDLVSQELNKLNKQIKAVEKKRKQRNQQQSWLQDFMNVSDFAEIDWRSIELKKQELERDLVELEASSDRLKELESQLKEVQEKITATDSQRDSLLRDIQTLENDFKKAEKEKLDCQEKFISVEIQQLEDFYSNNKNRLQRYKLNFETIDQDTEKIINKLDQEIATKKNQQNSSQSAIQIRINNFKRDFRETTIEMGNDFNSLPEYIKLKNKIEQEDIPRHQKRFKSMMTEKIVNAILFFKSTLQEKESAIEEKINNLNKSLRQINYTDSTYIELQYQKNRDREIQDFKNSLKTCLGDVVRQTAEDNEERFKNIHKLLIKPFREETRWTNKVTDVRNWLDFAVSECDRSDNTEQSYYTGSAALSGGQKDKLACTILASAIAYQFGLHFSNFSGKSFRFVVIDEAFGKFDDNNARYAMELFKTLNLQLLMITPKAKISITEPYISSLHFVHNRETKDYSSIHTTSIQEFKENRQLALDKNRDQSL